MGDLEKWANENSKFIKIDDGGVYEGIFEGYKETTFRGNPLVEYIIDGKIFSSGSKKLARRMDAIKPQTKIRIRRFGLTTETNYEVEIIGEQNSVKDETAWDEQNETKQPF